MLLIVGGTGYVAGYILEALEGKMPRAGIRLFARSGAELDKLRSMGYQVAAGNVTDPRDFTAAMEGVDTVIYLTAIIREVKSKGQTFDRVIAEGAKNAAEAAKAAGVRRFILMSALGAGTVSSGYFRAKMRAEEAVKKSGVPYVIIRPSFLIGPGGEFTALLKRLTTFPVVPVLGPGNYRVQPMYVRDIARYMAQAIDDDRYMNETFEVGGPEVFDYNDMMRRVLAARHRPGVLFHAPLALVKPVVPLVEAVLPQLLTRDQLTMLLEGSWTKDRRLHEMGGFEPTPFARAIEIALNTRPPSTCVKVKAAPAHA